MRIIVYGLGYVGTVSAACLAREDHEVLGIDVDPTKVMFINSGASPIVERGLNEAIRDAVHRGKLTAVTKSTTEQIEADLSIVCVGTPNNENGSLNLNSIKKVCRQIACQLKNLRNYHVVNIRSTILPGTTETCIIPILEKNSSKRVGKDFGICVNPEFLREGSSLHDFYNPPFTLIGEYDQKSGNSIVEIYSNIDAPIIKTNIRTAEMLKYVNNAFHALKISFANEIGNLCKPLGIDSHEVMKIFCEDKNLNISPYYLKPGFAFGGSCLPKDLKALLYKGKENDLDLPLLNSILLSNERQITLAFDLIKKTGKKKIGILGISFKPGTDDLRESPSVELIEKLIGKGYDIKIYDNNIAIARVLGANRKFIETAIPHISSLMKSSLEDVIQNSEVIVICHNTQRFRTATANLANGKKIIDLVRITDKPKELSSYEGICW
ncbi:MAG: nucleotide sugar dehydrogenase [Candidatus Hodarchaeota archaeon]